MVKSVAAREKVSSVNEFNDFFFHEKFSFNPIASHLVFVSLFRFYKSNPLILFISHSPQSNHCVANELESSRAFHASDPR